MAKFFHVIARTDVGGTDAGSLRIRMSAHARNDRRERLARIAREVGLGHVVRVCRVDTGHPAGCELHVLTDTAVVLVLNERTYRLVTALVARPGQVRRYYSPFGEEAPDALVALAYEHTSVRHWNR